MRHHTAFLLTCTCCQKLRNCSEPSSSSTSYLRTMKELRDMEEAIRNDAPNSGRREREASSVLPQLFITDTIKDLLSREEYKRLRNQVPCSVSPLVSNYQRLTALVLPRRALRRLVSSSQTSFPVRSKCLRASFPADGSAFVIESAGIEWVWDPTNVRALSFECFSDVCEVHNRATILTISSALFDQSIKKLTSRRSNGREAVAWRECSCCGEPPEKEESLLSCLALSRSDPES